MTRSARLTRLVDYWQTLTPLSVDAIATMYTEDASFRDPFNDVTGIEKIRHIFADMFVRLDEPRFVIVETIEQPHGALLIRSCRGASTAARTSVSRPMTG
jgi:steroid Delta-isomerase